MRHHGPFALLLAFTVVAHAISPCLVTNPSSGFIVALGAVQPTVLTVNQLYQGKSSRFTWAFSMCTPRATFHSSLVELNCSSSGDGVYAAEFATGNTSRRCMNGFGALVEQGWGGGGPYTLADAPEGWRANVSIRCDKSTGGLTSPTGNITASGYGPVKFDIPLGHPAACVPSAFKANTNVTVLAIKRESTTKQSILDGFNTHFGVNVTDYSSPSVAVDGWQIVYIGLKSQYASVLPQLSQAQLESLFGIQNVTLLPAVHVGGGPAAHSRVWVFFVLLALIFALMVFEFNRKRQEVAERKAKREFGAEESEGSSLAPSTQV